MARYKCPSCGSPFDGKRCRECYYEHFTEEIAHGTHVHEGEPLVVKGTQPNRARRPAPSSPGSCRPYPGRRKAKSPAVKWLAVAAVILLSILSELPLDGGRTEIVEPEPDHSYWQTMPEDGITLYDDGSVCVMADWQQGREYADDLCIYFDNQTDRDLSVYTDVLYVNGFLLDASGLYCDAGAGETASVWLWLDGDELARSGIEEVAEITFDLYIFDSETYDTYGTSELITLECGVPLGFQQRVDDSGQVLFDQDGVRVIYKECLGSDCENAELLFLVENNSAHAVEVYIENAWVNGSEADIFLWCALQPGTRAVTDANLYDLPDIGVDTVSGIGSLELTFEMVTDGDWSDVTLTERLTVDLDS